MKKTSFSRPFGTRLVWAQFPNAKALGYCRVSLREKDLRFTNDHEARTAPRAQKFGFRRLELGASPAARQSAPARRRLDFGFWMLEFSS